MFGVNRVILIGNLGADPEVRNTSNQQSVTQFNLATSESWVNRKGERQEKTEWHRIVVWGKLAETCAKYLAKGRQVFVEGRLQTRSWETDQGQKRFTTEVVAKEVLFLGRAPQGMTKDDIVSSGDSSSSDSSAYKKEPEFSKQQSSSQKGDLPF